MKNGVTFREHEKSVVQRRATRPIVIASALLSLFAWRATHPASAYEKPDSKPAVAATEIDFAHDIAPLLQKRCAKCHTGTQRKGGLSINTRQSLLTGGDTGPGVVIRKSSESALIERLTATEAELRMPPEGERLTPDQIDLLRRWIDTGMPWADGFAFGKLSRQAPLAPRHPPLPPATADVAENANPIDRFLQPYLAENKVEPAKPVSDATFARRVSLDLIGMALSTSELDEFLADKSPDKRAQLVDRLLGDRPNYAAHWLTFWSDLLRNAYHGTGFIDGGRHQITGWLYGALYENKPYDRFVKELVSPPGGGSDGFIYGIKWRGTVNESQRREIQAAQSVAQVFLGTNLKCASCHDSFVNHWKLTDAYRLASVFAEGALELHRCDKPTGAPSEIGFLYPQLGEINAAASPAERLRQLAGLLTHPENGRLARTVVNRLWARMFGRGLVEPLENMDAEPWHQDLLDWLATDLADHGYDLKRTLRLIATSQAYQLPGVGHSAGAEPASEYVFRGPLVKRMTAEQFVDAVFELTSAWPACDASMLKRDGRGQGGQLGDVARALADREPGKVLSERRPLAQAKWIWIEGDAAAAQPSATWFRRLWKFEQRPARATATIAAPGAVELYINGKLIKKSDDWRKPLQVDVSDALAKGTNVIGVKIVRKEGDEDRAGAIGEIYTLGADGLRGEVLSTDNSWRTSRTEHADWLKDNFDAEGWTASTELGGFSAAPWNLEQLIAAGGTGVQTHAPLPAGFRIRAALLPLDALQSALGRPNREQIVSARDAVPTLLQALQLTNGTILEKYLEIGAATWRDANLGTPAALVDRLYRTALGRLPSGEERAVALEILGSSSGLDGIEDLLWTICMLPEFQIIP